MHLIATASRAQPSLAVHWANGERLPAPFVDDEMQEQSNRIETQSTISMKRNAGFANTKDEKWKKGAHLKFDM